MAIKKCTNEEVFHKVDESCVTCVSCGASATQTIMNMGDKNDPKETLIAVVCNTCQYKTVNFFDTCTAAKGAVKIVCNFTNEKDLQREVNLNQSAKVIIEADDFEYSYENLNPSVVTVETLLLQASDEIKKIIGEPSLANPNSVTPAGLTSEDIGKYKENISKIEGLKKNPKFKMTVIDQTGLSRVSKVGVGVTSIPYENAEHFNDEKVTHIFTK